MKIEPPSPLLTILAFYLLWPLMTFVFWLPGLFVDFGSATMSLRSMVSLVSFLLLASCLALLFLYCLQGWLAKKLGIRLLFLAGAILAHVFLYHLHQNLAFTHIWVESLVTANLLFISCLLATWMAMVIQRPAELVPLCAVMALVDLFSVLAGPTKNFAQEIDTYYSGGMEGTVPLVDYILVKFAMPGMEALVPVFGVSDWIFVVFFSAVVMKFGFNDNVFKSHIGAAYRRRKVVLYLPIAAVGLLVAVLMAQFTKISLPALPVMVSFFLAFMGLKYPYIRQLQKKEWQLLASSGGIMCLVLMGYYYR